MLPRPTKHHHSMSFTETHNVKTCDSLTERFRLFCRVDEIERKVYER